VQPLEEVHFDLFFVCGEIVLIFVDRASRHEWIYFLDKKSDLPKMLQQFLIDANSTHFTVGALTCAISSAMEKGIDAEALNLYLSSHHLAQRVKVFYSDNAREHLSHALDTFLFDMMIDQRFSVVESQHQNGLSENVGWNLLGPVRHDMDISNLSKELQRQGKLEARGEPGIYIGTGYHTKQSGYLVWLPRLHKTVIAEHVLFDETWFPARLDKQQSPQRTSATRKPTSSLMKSLQKMSFSSTTFSTTTSTCASPSTCLPPKTSSGKIWRGA
jgi:hypothetical protein